MQFLFIGSMKCRYAYDVVKLHASVAWVKF